jgi:hypothetical protein
VPDALPERKSISDDSFRDRLCRACEASVTAEFVAPVFPLERNRLTRVRPQRIAGPNSVRRNDDANRSTSRRIFNTRDARVIEGRNATLLDKSDANNAGRWARIN